ARRWLLNWIDRYPLSQFCSLRDEICNLDLGNERRLVKILFELVQDCRNVYLNCGCTGCDADEGVPLARVFLELMEGGGCHVLAIDPYPPYRRPIQPDCWPAPLGKVNVGRFIWHRWEEMCTALVDLGLH